MPPCCAAWVAWDLVCESCGKRHALPAPRPTPQLALRETRPGTIRRADDGTYSLLLDGSTYPLGSYPSTKGD
jgi:hypothetical protein